MELPPSGHEPVMLGEVIEALAIRPGATVVDCTLGRAGHSSAIAQQLGTGGTLIGLDADPRNLEFAQTILRDSPCKVRLFHANFAQLEEVLEHADCSAVDAILADLGVSTNQLLDPRYGLSFSGDMPLDMRLNPESDITAERLVNTLSETELADTLFQLSDERHSRRIARKIVEARRNSPIKTTGRLADIVRSAVPSGPRVADRIDPATRTFMALRMRVNQEVENLGRLLKVSPGLLRQAGRIAVISFHSTEDRIVKQAFRSAEQTGLLRVVTKKPLSPSEAEQSENPRSRSAKLRVAERI